MQWALELFLVVMLGATLFHAVRLERALGVLKRDRKELEELVAGFNASTRQAEQGVERLRQATDGAGKQIAKQIDAALVLKDDLSFLLERSERSADRLDRLVRAARSGPAEPVHPAGPAPREPMHPARPAALEPMHPTRSTPLEPPRPARAAAFEPARLARAAAAEPARPAASDPVQTAEAARAADAEPLIGDARIRSQAERDLLKALRMVR